MARRRREWYAARPDARRRLRHPVISIGNIAAGGRGKTPLTASVARILMELGERPAILSRGYGRARHHSGVVIVRDAAAIRAGLESSGDEPLMLARRVHGAAVPQVDRVRGVRAQPARIAAVEEVVGRGPRCGADPALGLCRPGSRRRTQAYTAPLQLFEDFRGLQPSLCLLHHPVDPWGPRQPPPRRGPARSREAGCRRRRSSPTSVRRRRAPVPRRNKRAFASRCAR